MKQEKNQEQKRLRILGEDEIEALYGRPNFTSEERIHYFTLSQAETDLLAEFRSVKSQTYFILQLGYFKAQHLFFTFELHEVEDDVQYILEQYFPHVKMDKLSTVNKRTKLRQRRLICKLYNYRNCGAEERRKLEKKAQKAAMVCGKPIYIFRELLHYLQEEHIIAPGYSFLQDTVGQALHAKRRRRLHLQSLKQVLEARITEVNQRIEAGENEHFKIKKRSKKSRWTLSYPHGKETVNHPFFDRLRQVDIGNVMHFVNRKCQFMEAFAVLFTSRAKRSVHILGRYNKQEADERIITACLVTWGTNMRLGKMGEISDIKYQKLSTTSDNFIRPETLSEANDLVSNAIAELPIFQHYNIGERIHSSSDGQKFETLSSYHQCTLFTKILWT